MKVSLDLETIDAMSDPRHLMVPFPDRVRLTPEDYPTAIYAIGRKKGEVVVEIESRDKTYTHLLGSLINHSPGLYHAMMKERVSSLPMV